ncbi:MAG: prepilin-type N-terminal cleavage/methylation domain-containing protein [Defluviitaleaceae bacterium]|nr:prepilin-type N-terminal cleavage/methylation domain-containing protein [Defluviitaleaceae bacterium]
MRQYVKVLTPRQSFALQSFAPLGKGVAPPSQTNNLIGGVIRVDSLKENKENIKRNGFTLVELIVVIAVLAILAVVAVVAVRGVQANARRSVLLTDAASIARGINGINSARSGENRIVDAGGLGNFLDTYAADGHLAIGQQGITVSIGSRERMDRAIYYLSYYDGTWIVDEDRIAVSTSR